MHFRGDGSPLRRVHLELRVFFFTLSLHPVLWIPRVRLLVHRNNNPFNGVYIRNILRLYSNSKGIRKGTLYAYFNFC